jgi:methyl halide transferase
LRSNRRPLSSQYLRPPYPPKLKNASIVDRSGSPAIIFSYFSVFCFFFLEKASLILNYHFRTLRRLLLTVYYCRNTPHPTPREGRWDMVLALGLKFCRALAASVVILAKPTLSVPYPSSSAAVAVAAVAAAHCINTNTTTTNNNMATAASEKEHARWAAAWVAGINPGDKFDAHFPLPALSQMVAEGSVPTGRALVPGCGRGYDVVLLASPERVAVGLDISEVAIAAAEAMYGALPEDEKKPPRASVVFQAQSFFDLPEDAESRFDFVYDYTFFCALDPSIRPLWAEKMAAIVTPGGELCTVIFPIGEREGGPPFQVSMEDYKAVLEPLGFEAFQLELLAPELCHPGRDGGAMGSMMTKSGVAPASAIGRWRKK